jgi:transposase, IS30 family
LSKKGYSLRSIAKVLKRSVSTLSDEISSNSVKGKYDPRKAHHKAYVKRRHSKYQGMKIVSNNNLRKFVEEHLYDDQSPRAISGRIKRIDKNIKYISKSGIYKYILSVYGRRIESHRNKRRQRRRRRRSKYTKLTDRTFIDKRPKYIEKRQRLGDTAADFIESGKTGKGILLVVVDRKIRVVFIEKITTVTIHNVHKSFLKIKQRFPEIRTITTDNDILFQKHKELEKLLNIKIYFCHPYHSWEKGSIENANRYIRRDIPKSSNISSYSRSFIHNLERKLNRRIMVCLKYRTPSEILRKTRGRKTKRRTRYA